MLFRSAGWGIDLDYCDIEWFALETNRDHSVVFGLAPGWPQLRSRLPFGPRSQASLQKAQGPGVQLQLLQRYWLGHRLGLL